MNKSTILHQAARTHEVILVDPNVDQVFCDGGIGPLGHPRVYYTFDGQDDVTCLYCDRMFIVNKE